MKKIILLFALFVFIGCGYKPTVQYAKNIIGSKVYTEVKIKLQDPENSVIIRDNIKDLVVKKFGSSLVSENESNTKLYITIKDVSFANLQYDMNGYVIMKRANVILHTKYVTKDDKFGFIDTDGSYDFSVSSNSLSDQERFNAINTTAVKALDTLISQLAVRGLLASE